MMAAYEERMRDIQHKDACLDVIARLLQKQANPNVNDNTGTVGFPCWARAEGPNVRSKSCDGARLSNTCRLQRPSQVAGQSRRRSVRSAFGCGAN